MAHVHCSQHSSLEPVWASFRVPLDGTDAARSPPPRRAPPDDDARRRRFHTTGVAHSDGGRGLHPLLARAAVWSSTSERAANQAFNIANGDLFRWDDMWPRLARALGVEVAPPLPMVLADVMADKEPLWDALVARHGLARTPYRDVSCWRFGDAVFSWDYDLIADGSRARRLGFHEHVDTEAMFTRTFAALRRLRILP